MINPNCNPIWTEKHVEFALSKNLTHSARTLWEYLVHEGLTGVEIVDLRCFNVWVKKHRGRAYDRRTVKDAAERLIKSGIVDEKIAFTAFVRKWVIKPLGGLMKPILNQDKNSKARSKIAGLGASNYSFANDQHITTTTYIDHELVEAAQSVVQDDEVLEELYENVDACKKAGINYSPQEAIKLLAWRSVEEVARAIAYTLQRAKSNVAGYLRVILERDALSVNQPATLLEVAHQLTECDRFIKRGYAS